MEFPDDVVKLIREYSSPYRNWRAGSYIYKKLIKIRMNLLEELQIWILLGRFSYSRLNYLRIQYNLLKKSTMYRKHVNGEYWNANLYMKYFRPEIGPKIPRPVNFSVLIGNTKKLLKDEYKRPSQFGFGLRYYNRDIERRVSFETRHHKEMKLMYPDRLFGYNDS